MEVLRIQGLSKSFGGRSILDGLDMTVPEGSVFGFIGQNGAGKTTTMKLILGLLRPDQGEISVCGEAVRFGQTRTNRYIGYLPDVPEFYDYMTPGQYLALCGAAAGLPKEESRQRGAQLLSLVGLPEGRGAIGSFSRGMKQRLGIAQALLARPKLLICDEPTSALDPVGRKEILELLGRLSGTTTVLFSTHILSDVERICDRVALLRRGRIAVGGTLAEIRASHGREGLLLEFPTEQAMRTFQDQEGVRALLPEAEENGRELVLHSGEIEVLQHTVFEILARERLCPIRMERLAPSLEHLFLEEIS